MLINKYRKLLHKIHIRFPLKLSTVTKSLRNRQGNILLRLFSSTLGVMIVMYLMCYGLELWLSFSIDNNLNKIANQMTTVISQNSKLTSSMQNKFKQSLDKNKFFTNNYVVKYEKFVYHKSGDYFSRERIGTSNGGSSIGDYTFDRGDMIRVVIYSESSNKLGDLAKLFGGSSAKSAASSEAYIE